MKLESDDRDLMKCGAMKKLVDSYWVSYQDGHSINPLKSDSYYMYHLF
jgi:hypothetical protein